MKTLVQAKLYPIQITRATYDGGDRNTVEFNLNNINWAILKNRIDTENAFSLSTIFLKFPPGGETVYYRKYEDQYSLNTVKKIPPSTEPITVNVENYLSTPLTGSLNKTTDYDLAHPFNTFLAIDEAVNPTNISGFMWIKCNISPYVVQGSQFWNQNYVWFRLAPDWKVPVILNVTIKQNNIAVTTANTRLPIEVNWTASVQDIAEIQVIKNNAVIATIPVGAERTATIPANTLTSGDFTIKIVAANNPIDDLGVTGEASKAFTATTVLPTITSLEPDGINQNANEQINVSWVSTLQDSWKLDIYLDDVLKKTYQGTTEKALVIPKNTLTTDNVKMVLTIASTVAGSTVYATRTANFFAYAKPPVPVFTPQTIYNQVKPIFSWTATEQISYQFIIETIVDTGEVVSTNNYYQPVVNLQNNQSYIIKVRVKNQFGLWSDYAEKSILISYTELPKPNFNLTIDGSGILVTILYTDNSDLKDMEIWRKSELDNNFARMAYGLKYNSQWNDRTVASGLRYEYKIIANGKSGGATESDTKIERTYVQAFEFSDIEDTSKNHTLIWNPLISNTSLRDIVARNYAGSKAVKIEYGTANYSAKKMTFDLESHIEYLRFKKLVEESKVLLLRDRRGDKKYGNITSEISENYIKGDWVTISFEFTEVDFVEKDIYAEQRLVLTYFDGTYKFDGTINFSGVHLE